MPHSLLSAALAEHHSSLCRPVPDWAKLPAKEKLGLSRTVRTEWRERAMYRAWKDQIEAVKICCKCRTSSACISDSSLLNELSSGPSMRPLLRAGAATACTFLVLGGVTLGTSSFVMTLVQAAVSQRKV